MDTIKPAKEWIFSIAKSFVLRPDIKPGAKVLWIAIRSFAGPEQTAFPGMELLCSRLLMSKDKIYRHLKELEQLGLIIRRQVHVEHGRFSHTEYEFPDPPCLQNPDTVNAVTVKSDANINHYQGEQIPRGNRAVGNLTPELPLQASPLPTQVPKRFTKPTLEEMRKYGEQIGLPGCECEACFDFYESKGWLVGRVPMKDWQAAMRNWKRGYNSKRIQQKPNQTRNSEFGIRGLDVQ
jgi:Helix-turn-helix domain